MPAYQLLERLGSDGRVHRARRNDIVASPMVLKRLDPATVGDLRRLRSVAERVARIGSPALVGIVDCQAEADHVTVATPAVDGTDLATRQRTLGRPSPSETIGIAVDLLDTLADLHAHGITHGAVHDRNVLIGRDGRLCLVDIALRAHGGQSSRVVPAVRDRRPVEDRAELAEHRPVDDIVDAFDTIRTLIDPGTTDADSRDLLRLAHRLVERDRAGEPIPGAAALADCLRARLTAPVVMPSPTLAADPAGSDARPLVAASALAITIGVMAGAVLSTTPGF